MFKFMIFTVSGVMSLGYFYNGKAGEALGPLPSRQWREVWLSTCDGGCST